MKKIGFVTPWYGESIPGGAEMALRGVTQHLKKAGLTIEILSTCVKEFSSDWNDNYHNPGKTIENGLTVWRFKVKKRDVHAFDEVNYKLINHKLISKEEELIFINEMINSPDLYKYIADNKDNYDLFVYIPYMFGTTYFGIKVCPEKAVLIPCFHDESYMYLDIFKKLYSKVAGMIFNAQPEADLANKIYNLSKVKQCVAGLGIDTCLTGNENNFRDKYNIKEPFILYAGRKDVGKNVDTLIRYFTEYKNRQVSLFKLVLIGGGKIEIPELMSNDIIDLGFVSAQDKFDAYSAALCLCQPSKNESFSLVIMESWLCNRPVLVHSECKVTEYFSRVSNGGLYFKDYNEFEGCINYYQRHNDNADIMGRLGHDFVLQNFDWDIIVNKYINVFNDIIKVGD